MGNITNAELLIENFFDGNLSEEEGRKLVSWLDRDERNVDAFLLHVDLHASLFEELAEVPATGEFRAVRRTARRRRPSRTLAWVPVAAAAAVLLAVGIWLLSPSVPPGIVTIVRKSGSVKVTDDSIATGPDSWCLAKYADGTILALDEKTEVGLALDRNTRQKTVDLYRGRTYFDVVPQNKPFTIATGEAKAEVLGTKLQVIRKEQTFLAMAEGLVKVTDLDTGVYVRGQQAVKAWRGAGPSRATMKVARIPEERPAYAWLEKMGIDVDALLATAGRATPRYKDSQCDFDNYTVYGGVWTVEQGAGGVIVRQEKVLASAKGYYGIQFGTEKWSGGVLSFDFKLKKRPSESSPAQWGIYALFHHKDGFDYMGVSRVIPELLAHGDWIHMDVEFRVGDRDNLVTTVKASATGKRDTMKAWTFEKHPGNSRIKKRDRCGVGLCSTGYAVEFRNIKLTKAR
jgi:ferric-dicitrate binding protein FerR (iron transport regulator)